MLSHIVTKSCTISGKIRSVGDCPPFFQWFMNTTRKDPETGIIREECQDTPTHGDLPAPSIYVGFCKLLYIPMFSISEI